MPRYPLDIRERMPSLRYCRACDTYHRRDDAEGAPISLAEANRMIAEDPSVVTPEVFNRPRTHDNSVNPPRRLRKMKCRCCNRLKNRTQLSYLPGEIVDPEGRVYQRALVCDQCRAGNALNRCFGGEGACGRWAPNNTFRFVDGQLRCRACWSTSVQCGHCHNHTRTNAGSERRPLCTNCRRYYSDCADCQQQYVPSTSSAQRARNVNMAGAPVCTNCATRYASCTTCGCRFRTSDGGGLDPVTEQYYCAQHSPNYDDPNFRWPLDNNYTSREAGPRVPPRSTERTRGSDRTFGVELEFGKSGRAASNHIVSKTGWGACPDGTSGVTQEFKSPILAGDAGIESVEKLTEMVNRMGFDVNKSCGFHLHIGVRGEKNDTLARIATACQTFLPLWKCFVPPSRRSNRYCCYDHHYGDPPKMAKGGDDFLHRGERYCAWNWCAYGEHGTVENRLHTGTKNGEKVVNWILANLALVEWAKGVKMNEILEHYKKPVSKQFSFLATSVWPTPVANFYKARALKFGIDLSGCPIADDKLQPQNPEEPGWEWSDEDRRMTMQQFGAACLRENADYYLRRAWERGYLSRSPGDFVSPYLPLTVAGYSERSENDP